MLAKSALLAFACLILGVTILLFGNSPSKVISPIPQVLSARSIPTPSPTNTPTPIESGPTPTLIPTVIPTPEPTSTPTPPRPAPPAPSELEQLFTKYSDEYSIDKELLKRIAYCESGFNANASNVAYAGLYQFSEILWIQTRTLTGQNPDVDLRFNADESIRTAAFMISQNHLSIWPHCSS